MPSRLHSYLRNLCGARKSIRACHVVGGKQFCSGVSQEGLAQMAEPHADKSSAKHCVETIPNGIQKQFCVTVYAASSSLVGDDYDSAAYNLGKVRVFLSILSCVFRFSIGTLRRLTYVVVMSISLCIGHCQPELGAGQWWWTGAHGCLYTRCIVGRRCC